MTSKMRAARLAKLLREAQRYLCRDNPEQGDYCKCGAYVGAGEKHRSGCLWCRIRNELAK